MLTRDSRDPCRHLGRRLGGRVLKLALVAFIGALPSLLRAAEHVIHISVDGLSSRLLQAAIDAGDAPTFKRLQNEGAWTNNARTDFTHTVTLPNHTSMITGRPVLQPDGLEQVVCHNWTENGVPKRNTTLHNNHPAAGYIASTFDVVHDAGRSTALYTGKDKFVIYTQTYGENGGADHPRGRSKIDTYVYHEDEAPIYSATLNQRFLADMKSRRYTYAFVHYRDPDAAGHALGWGGSAYRQTIKNVDRNLADLLRLLETDQNLAGRTAIVLTADHGGMWFSHGNPEFAPDYIIPVMAWGAGVGRGDLYKINAASRADPGDGRLDYCAPQQPIRNGDTGNLALSLMGLGPIPGSFINAKQDLRVALAGDYNLDGTVDAADEVVWRETEGSTTDLRADGNRDGQIDQADYDLWKSHFGESAIAIQ